MEREDEAHREHVAAQEVAKDKEGEVKAVQAERQHVHKVGGPALVHMEAP